jgi:predicted amidohydrolase YtcJ
MDLDRAVYAYTEGASFLSGDESGCAGVARGRNADLVVLDRRLDTCDIGSSSIVLTCVGGEIVYDAMEDR